MILLIHPQSWAIIKQFTLIMKSQRSLRLERSRNLRKKESNSPTLASSYSQKRLWSKNFKNQPFPKQLQRRLIGHKFKFSDFSDDEEESNVKVVEEEEEIDVLEKKKKILPHFEIISDRGEFVGTRSRLHSQKKYNPTSPRCKSVESLKLPQVMQEKKEEDEQKLARSKLSQFKDKNEFNQHSRNSDTNSHTDKESLQLNYLAPSVPEIIENQAEQTKSDQLNRHDRSIISDEIDKLIVDQVDQKKRKKEEQQQFQAIEQQKHEQQTENVNKLRISLEKLELETQYLSKFKQDELKISRNGSETSENELQKREKPKKSRKQETINQNHQ